MTDTIFIKTKAGETLMGVLTYFDEERSELYVTNIIKLITSFSTDPTTNISVPFNMPHLYSNFGVEEAFMTFNLLDIYGWDMLNEYYDKYYRSVYTELQRMEKAKQKYVAEAMNTIASSLGEDGKSDEESESFYIDPNDGTIDKIIH